MSPDLSLESQPRKAPLASLMAQDMVQMAQGAHLKSNETLHSVGSIQTVKTVHPQSAFLKPYRQERGAGIRRYACKSNNYRTVT